MQSGDAQPEIGARPLGCRNAGVGCGVGCFERAPHLPSRFCSLKAALLCGRTFASRGRSIRMRLFMAVLAAYATFLWTLPTTAATGTLGDEFRAGPLGGGGG